jgi:uncharacterized protein (TIGR02588 family)
VTDDTQRQDSSSAPQQRDSGDRSENHSSGGEDTPLLEWITGLVGMALLLGTIGFLLWHALQANHTPPSIRVEVRAISQQGDQFLVQFEATNDGDQTAADVTIEGQLIRDGETVETSTATITYIPAQSMRRGGLFFTQDPGAYTLDLRATGYEKP